MKLAMHAAAWVLLVFGLFFAGPAPQAAASAADLEYTECANDEGFGECQHFLRNPSGPTDDPCWCDKCRNGTTGQKHDGHTMPSGWNPQLFESGGMDAYLKRHSVAWGINCSDCVQNEKAWPDGGGGSKGTAPDTDHAGRPAKATALERLKKESTLFKKPGNVIVAYNRHFYFVTDITGLKVRTPGGSSRLITMHEWAHLMIERAEFARREFVRNLGEPNISKPVAIFAIEKQRDVARFNAEYFGSANSDALNGSGDRVCDGFCNSGQSMSQERVGDDKQLQVQMRHMLVHNLLTCWATHEIRPKSLPQWMCEGLAHWLTRTLAPLKDECTVCKGEASATQGGAGGRGVGSSGLTVDGSGWNADLISMIQSQKLDPIEKLLAKTVVKDLTAEDHKRSWSYVDLGLSEWREPFAKMLAALRQEKDVREAFMSNLGCTPEVFDERWRARVLGKRKSLAPTALEAEPDTGDGPGARDRRALMSEENVTTLAAKIRALGVIDDKKTLRCVVDLMERNDDLIRETALVTLLKTSDVICRETLVEYGLTHSDAIVRAYCARICGRLDLTGALDRLEAMLEDKNWYARAEAGIACASMGHIKAMAGLRKIASSDPSDKAQIGAIDALAMFKEEAQTAAPILVKKLDSAQWQIRIAAVQALGQIGSMESVEGLIARMEKESGRLRDELYEALKEISRDDLGRNPEAWRKWWDREKANAPNGIPKRPEAKKKERDPNDARATHDGGPPPYFGVEIYSNRVGFVFDTSESMLTLFRPDPSAAKALSREYNGHNKLTICKEEIAQAVRGLDPRAHFNVVAFGKQIRSFKQNPVPASPGNIESVVGFLSSLPGEGETNYFDALKAALDLGEKPDTNPDLKATPDTITFLTDGVPTKGAMIDGDTLLEWYTGLNRYARVKTHTITFGTIGIDQLLLRGMAERNGGRFTLVLELPGDQKKR